MPTTEYSVQHAVALGDEAAMGLLTAQSSNHLCGQVVSVDCGGTAVEAVVASVCNINAYNCGVDMIRKTWDEATGGQSPGIAQCTVSLKNTLPMTSASPECFFRPSSETGNEWYASVGIFNTGGRLPVSATLNGIAGTFNGGSAFFDFSGSIGPHSGSSAQFITTFADGTSISVPFSQCTHTGETYIWSSASTTPATTAPTTTTSASAATTSASTTSTPASTTASTGGSCSAAWIQCGGLAWGGATCCVEGNTCTRQSDHYSQCVPTPSTSTPASTTATPASTTAAPASTTASTGGSCSAVWVQCGGLSWGGATCCMEGSICTRQSDYYSQCVPA